MMKGMCWVSTLHYITCAFQRVAHCKKKGRAAHFQGQAGSRVWDCAHSLVTDNCQPAVWCFANMAQADGDRASATGIETKTKEQKMWGVLAALGTVAFAYNYSNVSINHAHMIMTLIAPSGQQLWHQQPATCCCYELS